MRKITKEPKLQNVHKLQLLKRINPALLDNMEAKQHLILFERVTEEDNPLFESMESREEIGIGIYNSFVGDFRRIANYVPSHLIDNGDRCMVPCLNYFRYFKLKSGY